jgi:hypothetical protein
MQRLACLDRDFPVDPTFPIWLANSSPMIAEQAVSGKREALMVRVCSGWAGHLAIGSLILSREKVSGTFLSVGKGVRNLPEA